MFMSQLVSMYLKKNADLNLVPKLWLRPGVGNLFTSRGYFSASISQEGHKQKFCMCLFKSCIATIGKQVVA